MSLAIGKQLVPVDDLRVLRVLDLQPRRRPPVRPVGAVRPLADDPFQVSLAGRAKQITAAPRKMIQVVP